MSCSKDETTMSIPQESNAIEFGTYVGRDAQTRASVFTTSELASQGFGVFAYYTGTATYAEWLANTEVTSKAPNFMNNQKVAATGTGEPIVYTWSYSPIKYWPNNDGDKVTFLVYAPWVASPTLNDGGTFDFVVQNEITAQTDLVWNTSSHINKPKAVVGAAGVVNFTFGHALARIGLLLEAAVDQVAVGGTLDANTTITVNSVTFSDSFYTGGTLDLTATSATWGTLTGTQGFVFNTTNSNLQNNVITGESHKTPLQLNTNESYLMVIPQDFSSTGFDVTVDYNVVTTDPTTDGTGGGGSDINNTITRPVNLKLEAGKAYTLKLHIGMNSVDITATVTPWSDVTPETVVNVPINN